MLMLPLATIAQDSYVIQTGNSEKLIIQLITKTTNICDIKIGYCVSKATPTKQSVVAHIGLLYQAVDAVTR